ncbi:hypothetical protein GQ44DRAFT_691327 [Phaeosphaeriaceae sp. PMI808]|nr:hypothetical protein GQ44DRAFT_691327 [Phaeosphaeriaceae sp. PMI808]
MAAPTVFENIAEDFDLEGMGLLFAGKKFWVAQRVPSRTRLIDDIKANGGEIVLLEKKADYMIADHLRRECPPGSISYQFVEKSIEDGQIRDPEQHLAGPPLGEAREPGSISRPAKGGRALYTAEEDRILYKWVRDHEAGGGRAGGNEIYKQLEAKYPRHTWQSWRDRYLKQLQTRPPSAFNIPDNAPPSPPTDAPAEEAPPRAANKAGSRIKGKAKVKATTSYTVDELAEAFDADDWDELYAFVDLIDATREGGRYDDAWVQWAKNQDNQTAEQWRQYYEKVVRPQWLRDPEWKRKQIKEKTEKKLNERSQSQSISQQQEEASSQKADDETTKKVPTTTTVREATLSAQKQQTEATKLTSETKLMSSSTAQQESPRYISELYQKALKRVREDDNTEEEDLGEQSRLFKRQKSTSPMIKREKQPEAFIRTRHSPLQRLSNESPASQSEASEDQVHEQIMKDIGSTQVRNEDVCELHYAEADKEIESVESDDFPPFDRFPPSPNWVIEPSEEDLPSNTPTPRATRRKINNFDTQAILSSPTRNLVIDRLPRPVGYTRDLGNEAPFRSLSDAPHPESDASTTQSLQDFRRSLNDEDILQLSRPKPKPLARPASPSPTPSTSSSDTGDPDVPLDASEFDEFFAAQYEEGFDDDFITKALKRTRCRPVLAETVLEAWKHGKPLPVQRGIWSCEDDEAAESGDGVALARLERKHTLDGWGGLTERLRFLEGYRMR